MWSYLNLIREVKEDGEQHDDRTGVGTVSLFGRQWEHDFRNGFPLLTTKKVPLRWVAEELFWFLSGSTSELDLAAKGVDIWKEWATDEQCAKFGREAGDLGPVYGGLWRTFPGGKSRQDKNIEVEHVDQIKNLYRDMETSPNSRRLIVTGWHPFYQSRVALPPCHTLWQVKIHPAKLGQNEGISLRLDARSIDSFLGLPFNIASYALLLSLLATTTNRTPRRLIIQFGDLHIYKNHFAQVEQQLSRDPYRLPTIEINERLQGSGFNGLMSATWSDITLHNYVHHPKIEAPVAV